MSPTYKFREVRHPSRKRGKCPACGKVVTRSIMFTQTLNPFNKNADGEVKTVNQIWVELQAASKEWVPDFTHDKCKEGK